MSPAEKSVWQYQEAKAKLSQLMNCVLREGVQVIVRNRVEEYVVITRAEYKSLLSPKTSLVDFFKEAPCPDVELEIERSRDLPREITL